LQPFADEDTTASTTERPFAVVCETDLRGKPIDSNAALRKVTAANQELPATPFYPMPLWPCVTRLVGRAREEDDKAQSIIGEMHMISKIVPSYSRTYT